MSIFNNQWRIRQQEDQLLSAEIETAFQTSRETYGSPRLTLDVPNAAHRQFIPDKNAPSFQNQLSLFLHFITPNRLLGPAPTTVPDQVWARAITSIPTSEGWLYLAAVMDLCSRRILGCATADHMREELVAQACTRSMFARQGRPLQHTILPSDRGSQYFAFTYQNTLRLLQDASKLSRPANCCDDATIESFWSFLKTEAFTSIPQNH